MFFPKRSAALAVGFVTTLSLATLGQNPAPAARGGETLVVDDAQIEWVEKSDVAALREGVIERIELDHGMVVAKGKPIGYLHHETADLTVEKAVQIYKSTAAEEKALAQRELALSVLATSVRLNQRNKDMVSKEEMQKAEAEVKVAEAMRHEAIEKRKIDAADLALAKQAVEEHTIRAPFDGIVLERLKSPGESIRANEAVVRLGNMDKLRCFAYVPLEYAYRVKEGQIIEVQPRLVDVRGGAPNPIEQKKFRGKITFVDPQIQAVAESAVRVFAEVENKDHELRPGLKAVMTIYLSDEVPTRTAGARTNP
ncbi:efflux RND transporter periplasmic adaptor subunit [Singulisphaera sp. PoT]|uniref:efflux RND transporter periplasmic adaptor subunit n=1 Tax=Singulisphaera sp. PoT TaxID=3411797 RepID=UPI003BF477D6